MRGGRSKHLDIDAYSYGGARAQSGGRQAVGGVRLGASGLHDAVGSAQAELVLVAKPRCTQAQIDAALRQHQGHPRLRCVVRGAASQTPRPGVVFTELDAYWPTERAPLVEDLAEACRSFMQRAYTLPVDVLWGSAMQRVLYEAFTERLYALGLEHFHARDQIVFIHEDRAFPRVLLPALFAVEALALVVRRLTERALATRHEAPGVERWYAVIGDVSRHILALMQDDASRTARLLVAPITSLEHGEQVAHARGHLLPTLRDAVRCVFHLSAVPGLTLTRRRAQQLIRVATFDSLRAREAAAATERVCERHAFEGKQVVFPHASLAAVCAVDKVLQAHGAETIEVVHGALADPLDMLTHARSTTRTKVFWTLPEAEMHARYVTHQRVHAGFSPPFAPIAQRGNGVLVLSNYAHPYLGFDGPSPREPYLHMLWLAILQALPETAIVWRPHPGDDRAAIARALPSGVTLSTATLEDDLANASTVIATVSTTIAEAARAHHVAIFVHDIPYHERDVVMRLFDPRRVFRDGADLAKKLRAKRTRAPENALRKRLFGGDARTVRELLC